MRTFLKKLVLLAVVAAMIGALTGCSDQTEEANAAIDRANAEIERYNKRDAEIGERLDRVDAIMQGSEANEANAKEAAAVVDEVLAKLAEQKTSVTKTRGEFQKIGSMDVSDEFKKYAQMQIEVADKQLEQEGLVGELATGTRDLLNALISGKATEASIDTLATAMDEKSSKLDTVAEELDKLATAAEAYFEANLAE